VLHFVNYSLLMSLYETTESNNVNRHKTRFILMRNICLCDSKNQY